MRTILAAAIALTIGVAVGPTTASAAPMIAAKPIAGPSEELLQKAHYYRHHRHHRHYYYRHHHHHYYRHHHRHWHW